MQKWHANCNEIVQAQSVDENANTENSFAKHQLGIANCETRILAVKWSTVEGTISTVFTLKDSEITKRGVLKALASIYDPLGIATPLTLIGKLIFREICENQGKWDSELSEALKRKCLRWTISLPEKV